MKAIRIVILSLLGIVSLAVIAAAVFLLTFDPDQYKGDIERMVKDQTGRTLVLSDNIQMSLFPTLGVTLGPTTLTETDGKTTFASAESAKVSVAVMPLLKKQIMVDGIELRGLVAHITRRENGTFNFQDLSERQGEPGTDQKVEVTDREGQTTAVSFDVASVVLENADISYLDQRTGQRIDIKSLDLTTGRIATQSRGELNITAQVQAPAPAVNARISLKGQYALDTMQQTLALDNLVFGLNGSAMQIQNLSLSAKSSLQADFSESRIDLRSMQVDASAKNLFKASLRSAGLIWHDNRLTVQQFSASGNVDQPGQKLAVEIQTPEISASQQKLTVEKFTGTLQVDKPDLLRQPIKVPVQGRIDANLQKPSLATTIHASLDDSSLNLSLDIPRFSPTAYRATLRIDQIDLDRYLAQTAAPGNPTAATSQSGSSPSDAGKGTIGDIDLSALNQLDLQAKISIDQIKVRGLTLGKLRSDLSAAKGQLRVGPHSANISGGSVKGDLTVSAATNQFRLNEAFSGIAIGQLQRDLAHPSRIEGTANLNLNLSTQGRTAEQLTQNLSGTSSLQVKEGAIQGVDIARLLRSIRGVITSGKLPEFSSDDKTVFSELSASVNIRQGVATNKDLSMKAPLFRVQGEGDINLASSNLDYLAKLSVVETTQGQGGPELEALRGVTIPVRMTGPFDQIRYQIDIASVAAQLAQTKAGQTLTDRVEKLIGPDISNTLKGLFGR